MKMASTKIFAIALLVLIGIGGFVGFCRDGFPSACSEKMIICGKLVIPGAADEKYYDATMTINTSYIEILCKKKIFQPFNNFESPRSRKLKIMISDTSEIYLRKNRLYVLTDISFFKKYRHLFHRFFYTRRFFHLSPQDEEVYALVFQLSNPTDVGVREKRFLDKLNKKLRRTMASPSGWS
jgi:hypothetical protein